MSENIITLEDVSLVRRGKIILEGININLKRGDHLAIVGPNGAGKSFLLSIIAADIIPSSGRVTILEHTFGKSSLWDIRKKVGFLSSRMIHWISEKAKVFEVVGSAFFGSYGISEPLSLDQIVKIRATLESFNLQEFENSDFAVLSDGEKRKVLLCRALVTEPEFLILDEPCQGLDIKTRKLFLEDMDNLAKKISLICVSHHLEEIPKSVNEVAFLKGGRFFARGKKEIMFSEAYLKEVFDCEVELVEKEGSYYMLN